MIIDSLSVDLGWSLTWRTFILQPLPTHAKNMWHVGKQYRKELCPITEAHHPAVNDFVLSPVPYWVSECLTPSYVAIWKIPENIWGYPKTFIETTRSFKFVNFVYSIKKSCIYVIFELHSKKDIYSFIVIGKRCEYNVIKSCFKIFHFSSGESNKIQDVLQKFFINTNVDVWKNYITKSVHLSNTAQYLHLRHMTFGNAHKLFYFFRCHYCVYSE